MEANRITIFGVAGSLRADSFNARLLRRASELAPPGVGFDLFDGLGALPHFNQDEEGDRTPAAVLEMRERIAKADAILVTTPEYNSAVPGVLKNALDWASRPPGESVLKDKPAAVAGASPGRFGAVRAQEQVRAVLGAIGAEVVDRELPVARAHEAFTDAGTIGEQAVERELGALLVALVELAGGAPPAEHPESFDYSVECQRIAGAA